MRTNWLRAASLLFVLAALAGGAACAETDVAASIYGAFTGTTNSNGAAQSPSNAAGGMLEVRHIAHPWLGFEGTYSFNHANQTYTAISHPPGIGAVLTGTTPISANAHEVTADWVASVKIANLRPFALAGGGLLFEVPSSSQVTETITTVGGSAPGTTTSVVNTRTTTKPVFVYGAGLDWGLLPHIGLRLQYRGNLYKAPNLTKLFTSVDAFTNTAEPMIGVFFRF